MGRLRSQLASSPYRALLATSLEYSAQLAICRGELSRARDFLADSQAIHSSANALGSLFTLKWRAIIRLRQEGAAALGEIEQVRRRAREIGHWETLRDCDHHVATVLGSKEIFGRVFCGTPHVAYRQSLLAAAPAGWQPPATYAWSSGSHGSPDSPPYSLFDLHRGHGRTRLPPAKILQRLLALLSRDFYRPVPVASLFARLHPDEFYHPETSPARVHQYVRRFRQWAEVRRIGLGIRFDAGYRLAFASGWGLVCYPREDAEKIQIEAQNLRELVGTQVFSSRDVQRILGVSLATSSRILKRVIEAGTIRKRGAGPGTVYEFVSPAGAKAA